MNLSNISAWNISATEAKVFDWLDGVKSEIADPEERKKFEFETSGFRKLYSRFLQKSFVKDQQIQWHKLRALPEDMVYPHSALSTCPEDDVRGLLEKLVVLKLNGGLGMTMGCKGPKSLLEVRDSKSFLDLTVEQVAHLNATYDVDIPLVLMNSFNTDTTTQSVLEKYSQNSVKIFTFVQKKYPRISKDTLLPLGFGKDFEESCSSENWYPPGHGDVFDSFHNTPIFQQLLEMGKEYVFISNIDNLGATVDLNILSFLVQHQTEACLESTNRTRSDVKGGTLVDYNGHARILEIGQVPNDKVEEFKRIKKFKLFNTNNLWVRMDAIARVTKDASLDLELLVNTETTQSGKKVVQLETACGSAVHLFKKAVTINVPRSRFLPVKSCSDLFVVQSNVYNLFHGTLAMNPQRVEKMGDLSVPHVKLGESFRKVQSYLERVDGVPDILELEHLTVSGNVKFGKGCSLRGTVVIVADKSGAIVIPDGTMLDNKVVSGSLHIVDH